MIMLAIANELLNDRERSYIAPALAPVAPLIGKEEFTAGG
jgi:hypothetical protein